MALIGKIRERTQLLVVIVSLGLLFFIARELIGFNPLSSNKSPIIGKVAGQKITLREFQDQFSNLQHSYFLDYEQAPSEEENALLRNRLWKNIIRDIVYGKLCKQLDLIVTEDELVDMVQGDHIHPDLQASFINPETKEFDKKTLLTYLQNLSQSGQSYQIYWYNLERNLAKSRCQTKFDQLVSQSVFVNSLEAQHQFVADSTSVDLQYLYIPYHTIKDEEVSIQEEMLKTYLQKHADEHQVKESKEIHYVTFPIRASENDQVDFNKELEILKQDFYKTQEDSLFASVHTDSNPALVYLKCTEQDLPTSLNQQKSTLQQRMVIGPLAEGADGYKLYKITKLVAGNPKKYEITVIEKTLTPSDETKESVFKKVDDFVHRVANKIQFESQAAADSLRIYSAKVGKEDTQINHLTHVRELVRWVYNEAQVGNVSPMFELPENYVVAVVTGHTKAGLAALDQVRDDIKQKVLDEEKAKIITRKLESISNDPFDSIVTQYGNDVKLFTAQGIKFNTTRLEGIGLAKKTISQAFALEPGQRSKIIAELSGIVLMEVKQRHLPTLPDSWKDKQKKQAKIEASRQSYQVIKALEQLANVQDYRYKYY